MEELIKLGNQLETDWRAADYDENVFPALAAGGLRAACLHEKYSAWQVLGWTLEQTELPKQRDLHGRFGESLNALCEPFVPYVLCSDSFTKTQSSHKGHRDTVCGLARFLCTLELHVPL